MSPAETTALISNVDLLLTKISTRQEIAPTLFQTRETEISIFTKRMRYPHCRCSSAHSTVIGEYYATDVQQSVKILRSTELQGESGN